jgi:hypothetical protein
VAHRLGFPGCAGDGEYILFYQGRAEQKMQLYCHNILSANPTTYITVSPRSNSSSMPKGGSCTGDSLHTSFSKIRVNPVTLMVKTDDYTFASTTPRNGCVRQRYWNNERQLALTQVPYATARCSNNLQRGQYRCQSDSEQFKAGMANGRASIDLRGTAFGVLDAAASRTWAARGCQAWGVLWVPEGRRLAAEHQRLAAEHQVDLDSVPSDPEQAPSSRTSCWQRLDLDGGGFAGRFGPALDRTLDERATGQNYDDEGNNGGWCLQLGLLDLIDGGMEIERPPLGVGAAREGPLSPLQSDKENSEEQADLCKNIYAMVGC